MELRDHLVLRNVLLPSLSESGLTPSTVVISGNEVAAVLPPHAEPPSYASIIDGAGRILLPGFVDAHSHAEGALHRPSIEQALVRQGITGAILGQDGISFAPTTAESAALGAQYFSAVNGPAPHGYSEGMSIEQLLEYYSEGTRINSAMLVPAGTVRTSIAGYSAARLTRAQLNMTETIVNEAIGEGAVGISLGLEYVPNRFADEIELALYARIAADHGVPLVAHIRGYELAIPDGLREFIELARTTGAQLHVSHLHAPAEIALPVIDEALDSGTDISFDSYPYHRGNTILAMLIIPADLQQNGPEQTLNALADPLVRKSLERSWFPSLVETFPKLTITVAPHPDWDWAEGLPLLEVARRLGTTVGAAVCDMLVATRLGVGAVVNQSASTSIENIRTIANHRAHLGSTDGIYLGSHPHPRGWGGFARMLRRHVIEWQDWSWADAAEHLSLRAARRFGLGNRGTATPGAIADFVLVDPHTLNDTATYENPTAYAHGMMDVIIAGVPVLTNGQLTEQSPGQGIRRSMRSQ
ncbi:MAG: N-acyl-D-amino-acid deacylase family protein [Leucobacter sp.]